MYSQHSWYRYVNCCMDIRSDDVIMFIRTCRYKVYHLTSEENTIITVYTYYFTVRRKVNSCSHGLQFCQWNVASFPGLLHFCSSLHSVYYTIYNVDFIIKYSVARQDPRRSQDHKCSTWLVRKFALRFIAHAFVAGDHPPHVHLTSTLRDKRSQAFPIFCHLSTSM